MKNKNGQALVEYVIIIGLISILAVGLVSYFGGFIKDALTKSSCPLVGEEYVPGIKRGEGKCVQPDNNASIESVFGY